MFGTTWHEARGKNDGDEALEGLIPDTWEAGKDVQGVVVVADFCRDGADGVDEVWDWGMEGVRWCGVGCCVWSSVRVCGVIVIGPSKEGVGVFLLVEAELLEALVGIDNRLLNFGAEFGRGAREVFVKVGVGEGSVKVEACTVWSCCVARGVHEMQVFASGVVHVVALIKFGGMKLCLFADGRG